jgi:hypothetical protein
MSAIAIATDRRHCAVILKPDLLTEKSDHITRVCRRGHYHSLGNPNYDGLGVRIRTPSPGSAPKACRQWFEQK